MRQKLQFWHKAIVDRWQSIVEQQEIDKNNHETWFLDNSSSSSLDDTEESKPTQSDDKQDQKHNNKLPQVQLIPMNYPSNWSFYLIFKQFTLGFLGQIPWYETCPRSVGNQTHQEACGWSGWSCPRSGTWCPPPLSPAVRVTQRSGSDPAQDQHLSNPRLWPLSHWHHQLWGPGPGLHQGLCHDCGQGEEKWQGWC